MKMKREYYVTKDGGLKRKENTIYFQNEHTKRALPIERINSIFAYSNLTLSGGVILYLGQKGIPVHFFDHYGWYKSTLYPRESLISGEMVVRQAEHYLDYIKRLKLAKKTVEGAAGNILRNLKYQAKKHSTLEPSIEQIEKLRDRIAQCNKINNLMREEGMIRETYYKALDKIYPQQYCMCKREKRPPTNKMNTLVSFGNSLVYSQVLSEIYNTQLNPTISFLHEPFERRFSLSLDVSEIFKPILADRIIMKLINKRMLDDKDFEGDIGDMLLSDSGKKKFLQEWDKRLNRTIKHKGLKRRVSYKRLIRLELYKLAKHFLGDKEYEPLVMWW